MISDLDPSLAPKLIKPNQWDRLKFTLASGKKKKKSNPCLSQEDGSNRLSILGALFLVVSTVFIKKTRMLTMEMGGNLEKRCIIMRGWGVVFVCTRGKTLLK